MTASHNSRKILSFLMIIEALFGHTKLLCVDDFFKDNAGLFGIGVALIASVSIYCRSSSQNAAKKRAHELELTVKSTELEKARLEREAQQRKHELERQQQQEEIRAQEEAKKMALLNHQTALLRRVDPTLPEEYARSLCATLPIDLLIAAAKNNTLYETITAFHKIHAWQNINSQAERNITNLQAWVTSTTTTLQEAHVAGRNLQQSIQNASNAELFTNQATRNASQERQRLHDLLEEMRQIARSVRQDKNATVGAQQKAKEYANQSKENAKSTSHGVENARKAAQDAKQAESKARQSAQTAQQSADLTVDVALQIPKVPAQSEVLPSAPPYEEEDPPSYVAATQKG